MAAHTLRRRCGESEITAPPAWLPKALIDAANFEMMDQLEAEIDLRMLSFLRL